MPGLVWPLVVRDGATPGFLRVAAAGDKAATAAGRAQARVATAGAKMSKTGAMMTRRLSLPLLAIGAASVKAATDFNASMTRIQTQAGASAKDVKILTAQVLGMKGAQFGPNALAGALYHLKSVGLANVPAMKALKAAQDLAAVGGANLEDTTNALAGAWRSGIKGAGSFAHTAATVNAIIGAGNMTLADFTEGLSTGILPAARTFGVSLQSIGAALSVFTDEGVPANVALTRMRMTLSLLGAPTDKATKLLDGIGISSTQLAKDMRTGPNGILNAVTDLKDHLSGLSKVAQAQFLSRAFGGGRSSSAIMTMLNQVGLLGRKWDQVTGSIGKYGDAVKTQAATPQAQFKVALANLEKAGVLLGNQLLPIVVQFAHAITGLATGFNGLSSRTKHFVTEVGIGLLVLGPMLSIVGKLTKAIAFMWAAGRGALTFAAGMRGATLATETMTSKTYLAGRGLSTMGRAAVGAGAAVAAIGIGFSIGRMTREASGGAKALGLLASVGTGAALGAGFGPLGVAVGGLVGGLSNLVGGMGGVSKAAQQMQTDITGLTAAFLKDGLAVGKTTNAYIAQQLAQSGVLDNAFALGLSYRTLTQAAHGNKAALDQVGAAMASGGETATAMGLEIFHLAKAFEAGKAKARANSAALHVFGNDAHTLAAGAHRTADAISRMATGSQNMAGASKAAGGAMASTTTAADGLNFSLKRLTAQYLNARNAALGIAMSELQFLDSLDTMKQALKDSNGSLSEHSAKSRAAREQLIGLAQAANQMDNGTRKGNASLLKHIQTLRADAIQAGASKGAVHNLLAEYKLLPRQIRTELHFDTSPARAALVAIMNQINSLHPTIHVGITGGHAPSNSGSFTGSKAAGGIIRGRGTGTSDSNLIAASNGEFVVRASQTAKHRSLLESINKGARGFAAGGYVGNPITTKQSGGKTVWIYKGTQYSTLQAAENAEGYRLTGAPGLRGTTYSSRHAADRALAHTIAMLGRVFTHMSRHDLPAFSKSLGKTGSDVKSAFSAWLDDAKKLGIDKATRHKLTVEDRSVAQLVNRRNRDQARLAGLRANRLAEKHTVAAAGRGVFDITSAGTSPTGGPGVSFGAIRAQEVQANHLVHKWAAGIRKLGKEGFNKSPTGLAMLRQLAEAGPSSWPQVSALLSASPKQLAGLISTERSIDRASGALGKYVGGQLYDPKIRHERAVVHTDMTKLHDAAVKLEHRMERFENRPVHVTLEVDGRVLATATAKGSKRNGRRK